MLLPWLAIILGLALLVWSADRFIDSASWVANRTGVPPLFIGIIVIGFGTSAPELVVSAIAALQGSPALALGNAFGSNIANIGLVLGLAALLYPLAITSSALRKEVLILGGVTLPELASVIAAARKGQHDLALGNILGSGLFNTLAVVGLAAAIAPFEVALSVLYRDWMIMGSLVAILCLCTLFQRPAGLRISRAGGAALLVIYTGYLGWIGASLAVL